MSGSYVLVCIVVPFIAGFGVSHWLIVSRRAVFYNSPQQSLAIASGCCMLSAAVVLFLAYVYNGWPHQLAIAPQFFSLGFSGSGIVHNVGRLNLQ